jgi:hypothetical protein
MGEAARGTCQQSSLPDRRVLSWIYLYCGPACGSHPLMICPPSVLPCTAPYRPVLQAQDFRIQYDSIVRVFLLPKANVPQTLVVISLDPPIRKGQTFYNHILCQVSCGWVGGLCGLCGLGRLAWDGLCVWWGAWVCGWMGWWRKDDGRRDGGMTTAGAGLLAGAHQSIQPACLPAGLLAC